MIAVSSTRVNCGLFSSSSFPFFLLPEQLVQSPLGGAEQVECVCVCVGGLGGWWAVVAQGRVLVSAWEEKGTHTGLSLARGSLAWAAWRGWAAWVRRWRLRGERWGSVWERGPTWGVMARHSEEGVSSSQGCYSAKDSKAWAERGRRLHWVLGGEGALQWSPSGVRRVPREEGVVVWSERAWAGWIHLVGQHGVGSWSPSGIRRTNERLVTEKWVD